MNDFMVTIEKHPTVSICLFFAVLWILEAIKDVVHGDK